MKKLETWQQASQNAVVKMAKNPDALLDKLPFESWHDLDQLLRDTVGRQQARSLPRTTSRRHASSDETDADLVESLRRQVEAPEKPDDKEEAPLTPEHEKHDQEAPSN